MPEVRGERVFLEGSQEVQQNPEMVAAYLAAQTAQLKEALRSLKDVAIVGDALGNQIDSILILTDNLVRSFRNLREEEIDKIYDKISAIQRSLSSLKNIDLGEVFSPAREIVEEMSTILSSSLLQLPEKLQQIQNIDLSPLARVAPEFVVRSVRERIASGDLDKLSDVVESLGNYLDKTEGSFRSVSESIDRFSQVTPDLLRQLIARDRAFLRNFSALFDRYFSSFSRTLGIDSIVNVVSQVRTISTRYGPQVAAAFAAIEAIKGIYEVVQNIYQYMRRNLGLLTLPGAGLPMAMAEMGAGPILNVQALREAARYTEEIRQRTLRAFHDIGLREEDYRRFWQDIRNAGVEVEAVFGNISVSGSLLNNNLRQAVGTMDHVIRTLYVYSYATGLSVSSLIQGAHQIMRLTNDRNFYRALETFESLNEVAVRMRISGQTFVKWVMDATESLRWYGYGLSENLRVIEKHTQALWKGLLTIGDFTRAINEFLGSNQQLGNLGFLFALRSSGELGAGLRTALQVGGFPEALEVYRLLLSSSPESIRRAAAIGGPAGEVAREVLDIFGSRLEEVSRAARLSQPRALEELFQGASPATRYMLYSAISPTLFGTQIERSAELYSMTLEQLRNLPSNIEQALSAVVEPFGQVAENMENLLSSNKTISQHLSEIKAAAWGILRHLLGSDGSVKIEVNTPRME